MKTTWEEEISHMLNTIDIETEKLLNSNLSNDDFHKKHQELTDYWHETLQRIQHKHTLTFKPKARPKHNHYSHHMNEKYHIKKLISKLNNDN